MRHTAEEAFVSCMLHSTPDVITHALKRITAGDLTDPAATVCRAVWHIATEQSAYTVTEPIDATAVLEKLTTEGVLDPPVQKLLETAISSSRPPAAMWGTHLHAIHEQRLRREAESLANAVAGFADGNINDLKASVRRFIKDAPPLMDRVPDDETPRPLKAA